MQMEMASAMYVMPAANDANNDSDGRWHFVADVDNCPDDANPNQEDDDMDSIGNLCDNCPDDANPNQDDDDMDGIGNACDPCPTVAGTNCCGTDPCSGTIILNSQADVDNFNCGGVLNGDLKIEGAGITDLSPLCGLTEITGYLNIFSTSITDLDGLENLHTIGQYLFIGGNQSLTSTAALQSLQNLGGSLTMNGNNSLQSIEGLQNLQSINGHLQVRYNASLIEMPGLSNLQHVTLSMSITDNSVLTNLDDFYNLTTVGTQLRIQNNPLLSDCCGIYPLLSNNGVGQPNFIVIYNNPSFCSSVNEILTTCSPADADMDGISDNLDNCPNDANPNQVRHVIWMA